MDQARIDYLQKHDLCADCTERRTSQVHRDLDPKAVRGAYDIPHHLFVEAPAAFSPYPATPASAKAYHVLMVERPELSIPQARAMFATLSADLVTFTLGVAQRQGMAALAQWSAFDQAPNGTGSLAVAFAEGMLA